MSSRLSRLVAHSRISRLFIKGNFDAYVLWPLAKRVHTWIVDSQLYGIQNSNIWHCFLPILECIYWTVTNRHCPTITGKQYKIGKKWSAILKQCTEVCFASFLSGWFITAIVVNPPESKRAKRTSVQWCGLGMDLVSAKICR